MPAESELLPPVRVLPYGSDRRRLVAKSRISVEKAMFLRIRNSSIRAVLFVVAALLIPGGARGQQPLQPVVNLQFNFSDPGARSMGFGGAFIGLADDATAAFANPAGLVQLSRPELSVEVRRSSYATPYIERGRVEGEPSGFGIDTISGLRMATSDEVVSGLSFLSVAYPWSKGSVAFFRHQLADFKLFTETQGLFGGGTDCCQVRFVDFRTSNDFNFVNYGLAAAYAINESFSLGLGVTYLDASLRAVTEVYGVDDDSIQALFSRNSYLPERLAYRDFAIIDDSDWSLTGGVLWAVSRGWKIGGVYRQGPQVEVESLLVAGRLIDFGVPPGEVISRSPGIRVDFPWSLGLGFSYRVPSDRLVVSFQWSHVEYSSILNSLELDNQTVDDVSELHLGGEYLLDLSKTLVALRLGVWLDPDHQLRATVDDPLVRALAPPGEDRVHFAAGLGVAFQSFQLDLGFDLSDRVDRASISAIYSF